MEDIVRRHSIRKTSGVDNLEIVRMDIDKYIAGYGVGTMDFGVTISSRTTSLS